MHYNKLNCLTVKESILQSWTEKINHNSILHAAVYSTSLQKRNIDKRLIEHKSLHVVSKN